MGKRRNYFVNIIFPALIFGSITGILTSLVVNLYKIAVHEVIGLSKQVYAFMADNLLTVLPALAILFGLSFVLAWIYQRNINISGDGIPTSIGLLRGILSFNWIKNLLGIIFLSLVTFFTGVPLGDEGLAVQIGTAIGRGSILPSQKKHMAWSRYAMTGGTCAGFTVATGAPISGIMFSLEEAHQRVTPMIIMVSCTSVLFSVITTEILSTFIHLHKTLLPPMSLPNLGVADLWIPLIIGIAMGLFAVVFLKFYVKTNRFFDKSLKKLPLFCKIFAIFALTLATGLVSFSFISTGHDLVNELFCENFAIPMLLLILLVRTVLTVSANSVGITGGMHLSVIAIGTVIVYIVTKILQYFVGFGSGYFSVMLVIGITACFAGMLKMPITAIVFSVEALSSHENILHVIIAAAVAYMITELFDVKSINETILDNKLEDYRHGKKFEVIDTFVTVQKGSFAIGKQIRDIFWPANLFVLSIKHDDTRTAEVDKHGEKDIREGDILHVRYSTYDEKATRAELIAIIGDQEYEETVDEVI